MFPCVSKPQFSLSELQQAGLLSGTDLQVFGDCGTASTLQGEAIQEGLQAFESSDKPERGRLDPSQDSLDHLLQHIRPQLGLIVGIQQSIRQQGQQPVDRPLRDGQGARSRFETEVDRKQASNREHQRRFRQRQKVSMARTASYNVPFVVGNVDIGLRIVAGSADMSCMP